MTASTTTTNQPSITVGRDLTRLDFEFVTSAHPGTPWSQLKLSWDKRINEGIIVVDSAGRRLAVATDGHRAHAVTIRNTVRPGLYETGDGYQRCTNEDTNDEVQRLVRNVFDEAQLPKTPHKIKVHIAQKWREDLLDLITQHKQVIVAMRRQSITVHDRKTEELITVLGPARPLADRTRACHVVTFDGRVLHEALRSRILTFTGPGQMGPFIGHLRTRTVLLAAMRPPVVTAEMFNAQGQPAGTEETATS